MGGASLSLAVFAALVAAITVVASMTVIGAVGLLLYSAIKQDEEEEFAPPVPLMPGSRPHDLQQPIDARRLLGFFDEEESSLSRFDPARRDPAPFNEVPFGTPEWTEEEGATEIFSAHNGGELSEFAFAEEEEISRLAAGSRSR
jgi:hypothetical protein